MTECDLGSTLLGEVINTGADGGKSHREDVIFMSKRQALVVTRSEQHILMGISKTG